MNLNDLKRRHNSLQHQGRNLYDRLCNMSDEINDLRKQIEVIEGEDYDPIPLIFGGDFHIREDGEKIEVTP